MQEDDLHASSKGVFVIPYRDDASQAGPSRPQPLQKLYEASVQHFERACTEYDEARTAEQLDDIADWLDQASAPPLLKLDPPIHRLPLAVMQNASVSLSEHFPTLGVEAATLQGRDVTDLTTTMKAIATGYIGETDQINSGRKTGRTGLDDLEKWWNAKRQKPGLLLHIQDAQMVPAAILSQLIYVLTLHHSLPIRLLLSVPSTTHFLASWTPLEPSSISLSILSSTQTRRYNGVEAVLRASATAPIRLSEDLASEIRAEEAKSGGGTAVALKTIKWLLLRYSMDSDLARIAADPAQHGRVQALVDAIAQHPEDESIPGRDLFVLHPHPDLHHVLNPAPRVSMLHALSHAADFVPLRAEQQPGEVDEQAVKVTAIGGGTNVSARTSKRKRPAEDERAVADETEVDQHPAGDPLKELRTLFELWQSAGRSVNLWDWLEGFSGVIMGDEEGSGVGEGEGEGNRDENVVGGGLGEKLGSEAVGKGAPQQDHGHADAVQSHPPDVTEAKEAAAAHEHENGHEQIEASRRRAEEQARLHAVFIRFVEEARMIGLIRARGKGKRADEVVKGVGLV
ncbi:hypothetical protein IAU60_004002 [Kwoniella sp. DSM 27419]